jgi:N-acetyl-gamma-glutamylphosphate reductase
MLRNHPMVTEVLAGSYRDVEYSVGPWRRSISVGIPGYECTGLVEIADNNPWVCAGHVNVPSAPVTAALIALSPLAAAGLIADEPVIQLSEDVSRDELAAELAIVGYNGESIVDTVAQDLGTVIAATVMVPVRTPENVSDLDGAFDERYGRSFFVREDSGSIWATTLVADTPFGFYRLRYTPDNNLSLLTVQVMIDRNGKGGAAQVIHAFNVMNGFEESLGIA